MRTERRADMSSVATALLTRLRMTNSSGKSLHLVTSAQRKNVLLYCIVLFRNGAHCDRVQTHSHLLIIIIIIIIYTSNLHTEYETYQNSTVILIIKSKYPHTLLFPFDNKIDVSDQTERTVSVQQLSRDSPNAGTKHPAPQHSVMPSGNHAWQTVDRPIIARTR
jgi:hypothetical protein